MLRFDQMSLQELIAKPHACACGRVHQAPLQFVRVGRNAVETLPEALHTIGSIHPFVVCDVNTQRAGWDRVRAVLERAGISYLLHCFHQEHLEPDEHAVGELCMAFDPACDAVIALGSGVINDCCKVFAHAAGRPQVIVGTAPSMDGYASNCASMIVDRVKTTLYSSCPAAIIADTEIMKDAPERMLWAGLGDMLAKYVALCEWRIAHLVTGEYYCENVAALMRHTLERIVEAAPRLMDRDPDVIGIIAEGLILSGVAIAFTGVSRPASGQEHYFSHVWEMFALDRGLPAELHGIQVGVGTMLCLRLYERLRSLKPDGEKARAYMAGFDPDKWEAQVRRVYGQAAQTLIDQENNLWHKNDPVAHEKRLEKILSCWPDILAAMDSLPDAQRIRQMMEHTGMPVHPEQIGESPQDVRDALVTARDTRDKYLTGSLLWDLGLLEEYAAWLAGISQS
ncbi:MAG: sn-glycerol-1-phosphate dehydrogenase [Clostridia bacterium]|nr:sn-glycerol-1-phosphate dehydrogenase [Clostridia bacterium]